MTMDARVLVALATLIVGCYVAILGAYRYIHKVERSMKISKEKERDARVKFEKDVIDRLARIETTLNHVKKGASGKATE